MIKTSTANDSSHQSCKHTLPTSVMAHKTQYSEELKHAIMMNIIIIKMSKVTPPQFLQGVCWVSYSSCLLNSMALLICVNIIILHLLAH